MRTTIYLATARGLAVIQGCDEGWVGEVCLNDKQIQCVAADRTRGIVYCGTFGDGMLRSGDRGATWHPLQNFTAPNVMALASSESGALDAGTELSAMYRSEDSSESWCELETLLTLPSAKSWSFPPRPETHHVQFILPHLAHPARLYVAIEAGALVYSDDAGRTWCDRVSSAPRDTHCLAVHPLDPTGCTQPPAMVISKVLMAVIVGDVLLTAWSISTAGASPSALQIQRLSCCPLRRAHTERTIKSRPTPSSIAAPEAMLGNRYEKDSPIRKVCGSP
jgi:hypothetical protein